MEKNFSKVINETYNVPEYFIELNSLGQVENVCKCISPDSPDTKVIAIENNGTSSYISIKPLDWMSYSFTHDRVRECSKEQYKEAVANVLAICK